MKLFGPLYDRVLEWSGRPKAPWFLGGLSFAESSFFPVPPDVMLAPMVLARPERANQLALLTTLTSVAGGLAGYLIGFFAIDLVEPLLRDAGYWDNYLRVQGWFADWGFWAVLAAGFSPIPYKLFTIAAGTLHMALLPFTAASIVGRGARFFLVAHLVRIGGPPMEARLKQHVEVLGWALVAILVIAWLIFRH
jgi:membrane protein YqaA with SNARE-associated domain